jgi:enoyl-CoA hydratase/carnithine racemase
MSHPETSASSGESGDAMPILDGTSRDGIALRIEGELAVVTLDRPERRNAMTPATWRALAEVGRALPGSVRVVLLRALGPSFCAGLHRDMFTPEGMPGEPSLFDLAALDDAALDAAIDTFQRGFTWWRRPDIITIALVRGHAVGAGFQLALACDLRLAADDARFAMREPTLGLVPDLAGTGPLVELVGYARALEWCVTARWIEVAEARETGLVNQVVPASRLDDAGRELAEAILANPRDAVIETTALLRGAAGRGYDDQRAAERAAQQRRLRDLAGRPRS